MKIDLTRPWAGMVPLRSVVRNPDQPRVRFPKDEITRLALSMKTQGQTSPCTVIPCPEERRSNGAVWMLIDGECRWRAALEADVTELLVCYQPGVTEANLHLASFAANFCRTPHTKEETARAVEKERAAGRSYDEIGAIVGKTGEWAKMHHDLLKLHPQLLQWMDEPDPQTGRKLSLNVAGLLVGIKDPEMQRLRYEKARKLPSKEQYHKLRTFGVASSGRRPSDDRDYLMGLLNTAHTRLESVTNSGEVILRRLPPEYVNGMLARLSDVAAACGRARDRLAKFTAGE